MKDYLEQPPRALWGVVLAGGVIRLYQLGVESFWLDEVHSILDATNFTIDPSRPLYYIVLRYWLDLFGASEFVARLPSVLFGVVAIPLIYAVGAQLFDQRVGLLSAGLLALSSFHIQHSQTVRMYSLLMMATLLSFFWMLRATDEASLSNVVGYVLSTALMGYTHVFGFLVIVVQNLYVFTAPLLAARVFRRGWSTVDLRQWLGMQVTTAVVLGPIILTVVDWVFLSSGGSGGGPAPNWIPLPSASTIYLTPVYFLGQSWSFTMNVLLLELLGACAVLGLTGYVLARNRGSNGFTLSPPDGRPLETYLVFLWASVPIVTLVTLSYVWQPIFKHRYVITTLPAFLILVAKGVQQIRIPSLQSVVAGLLLLSMLSSLFVAPGYFPNDQREQWDEAAAYIESNADSDALVVNSNSYANTTQLAFEFYFSRSDVRTTAAQTDDPERFRRIVRGYDSVWVVFAHTKPGEVQKARRLLDRTFTPVADREFVGITVVHYERGSNGGSTESAAKAGLTADDTAASARRSLTGRVPFAV